jgi:hypothetical protein
MLRIDVVGEILAGCRRDKLLPLPGGIVRDILAERICLRDATPWVMGVKVHQLRSKDEIWLEARVRFVSDADAGVQLKIVTVGGNLPVHVENISIEVMLMMMLEAMLVMAMVKTPASSCPPPPARPRRPRARR